MDEGVEEVVEAVGGKGWRGGIIIMGMSGYGRINDCDSFSLAMDAG